MRIVAAFAVAPGMFPFAMALYLQTFWSFVGFSIYTYGSAILFGIPLFFLCRRRRWLQWWHCVVAGTVASLPFLAILFGSLGILSVEVAAIVLGVGAASGLVFWVVGLVGSAAEPGVAPDPLAAGR